MPPSAFVYLINQARRRVDSFVEPLVRFLTWVFDNQLGRLLANASPWFAHVIAFGFALIYPAIFAQGAETTVETMVLKDAIAIGSLAAGGLVQLAGQAKALSNWHRQDRRVSEEARLPLTERSHEAILALELAKASARWLSVFFLVRFLPFAAIWVGIGLMANGDATGYFTWGAGTG